MLVSGLGAHLDHLWDMVVAYCFQPTWYNLRNVVEMAKELAFRHFWKLLGA